MKKILIALTIVISCLGISRVSADTYNAELLDVYESGCSYHYSDYNYIKELGFTDEMEQLYNLLIKEYNTNYSSEYPYYFVSYSFSDYKNCNQSETPTGVSSIYSSIFLYKEIPVYRYKVDHGYYNALPTSDILLRTSFNFDDNLYVTPYLDDNLEKDNRLIYQNVDSGIYYYSDFTYFISNFDLVNDTGDTFNITGNSNFTINPSDVIKPYYSVENAFHSNSIEINLNDYAYVALSLKDYNQESFSTQVYVKGNHCLTPVYNYGMTERKDILTGSQVERCSPYYDNYTPVRIYIDESDLKNNAIYYLKAYDTSKDNYIKVDTSIFDIAYITEENKDNPYVTIGGKTYPTIPYDNLTDTSTKSEDEGYVSGTVEEFSFSDIFTAPLDFLIEIWGTITTFFTLITSFIALLPPILQGFLYSSFTLAIVLGLIKILIGAL